MYTLGIDSSTQSLSAVLIHLETLSVSHSASVHFGSDLPDYNCLNGYLEQLPEGQIHADPLMWLTALELLFERLGEAGAPLDQVVALSGAGQQHGSVYLNDQFLPVLDKLDATQSLAAQLAPCLSRATSPIWMDNTTGQACQEIEAALGGRDAVCQRSGSVAVERFTGPQIRAFEQRAPEAYAQTAHIHLVSSFLCAVLAGRQAPIDWGDGAGMNLMNLADGQWDADLVRATATDLQAKLPPLAPAQTDVGTISPFFVTRFGLNPACRVVAFSGDNPASLVGMGAAQPGRVIISLGTSDTLFAAMPEARTDPAGCGHVFGNPLGGYMCLACFTNGSLSREAFRDQLDTDWDAFERAADTYLAADQLCLPFVQAEINPQHAAGVVETHPDAPTAQRVRAFLEGQAFNLRRQLDWMGVQPESVFLTGGASCNGGIAQVIADAFGVPTQRLAVSGSVALGSAMRAAMVAGIRQADLEAALCAPEPGSMCEPGALAPPRRRVAWRGASCWRTHQGSPAEAPILCASPCVFCSVQTSDPYA